MTAVFISELSGSALDYAVAVIEQSNKRYNYGKVCFDHKTKRVYETEGLRQIGVNYSPSSNVKDGMVIVFREGISLIRCEDDYVTDQKGFCTNKRIPIWAAEYGGNHSPQSSYEGEHYPPQYEITFDDCFHDQYPLVAAMRCFVASKIKGKMVEIPQELL